MKQILLVEDEYFAAQPIIEVLEKMEYNVLWVKYSHDAEIRLETDEYDAVILDLGILPSNEHIKQIEDEKDPTKWGRELCEKIHSINLNLPIIVITQWLHGDWRKNFIHYFGVFEFIEKDPSGDTKPILDNLIIELKKLERFSEMWTKLGKDINGVYLRWLAEAQPTQIQPDKRREITTALQDVRNKLSDVENIKILDLGCGNGAFLSIIDSHFNDLESQLGKIDYYGVDIDKNNIKKIEDKFNELLKRFGNYHFDCKEIKNMEFFNYMDMVLCINVLHEIKPPDICESLCKIVSALNVNGKAEIIDMEELEEGELDPVPWKCEAVKKILEILFDGNICEIYPLRYERKHGLKVPLFSLLINKKQICDGENYGTKISEAKKVAFKCLKERNKEIIEEITRLEEQIKAFITKDKLDAENIKIYINSFNKLMQLKNLDKWLTRWEEDEEMKSN